MALADVRVPERVAIVAPTRRAHRRFLAAAPSVAFEPLFAGGAGFAFGAKAPALAGGVAPLASRSRFTLPADATGAEVDGGAADAREAEEAGSRSWDLTFNLEAVADDAVAAAPMEDDVEDDSASRRRREARARGGSKSPLRPAIESTSAVCLAEAAVGLSMAMRCKPAEILLS